MMLSRPYQLAILCCTVLAVYYSALFTPICFVDDNKLVFLDLAGTELKQIVTAVFSGGGYYRPLLFVTYILDNYFWMLEESFMHLENVLLHGINALLLYAVMERIARRAKIPVDRGIPFVAALLFLLHPLATESVNWISGRTDPLACLFLLLSLKMLLDWLEASSIGRMFWIQICFLLACLSKETAVFFIGPALLLVMLSRASAIKPADRKATLPTVRSMFQAVRTDCLIHVSFILTTAAYFAMRRYAAMYTEGKDRGLNKLALYTTQQTQESLWFDKIMEVFKTVGFYAKKIVLPWPLNFNIVQASDWYALVGILAVVMLTRFCWRRRDLVAVLLLSAFLIGSSALLVSVGRLAWTPYAERYLYIPLIFFVPASILWLFEKTGKTWDGQLFRVIIIVICGASLITTVQRNLVWMDSAAFYELNYRQAPNLPISIKNYAVSLRQQGRIDESKMYLRLLPPKKKSVLTVKQQAQPE